MRIISITVRDKVAVTADRTRYVCGNSDYVIRFDFDEEWNDYDTKTARFVYGGNHQERVFSGNECPIPIIGGVGVFEVGVYAGNLHTTTPAIVPADKSILCKQGMPADPTPNVYAQLMEMIEGARLQGPQGEKGDVGETGPQGPQGEQGPKGDKGDTGPQGLQGETGLTGATGERGEKGEKGDTGLQGPIGEQGPKGDTGPQGETGPQGPKGDKGDKGDNGIQGIQGIQGVQGDPGKDGVSVTHNWNGTVLTITSADGTSSADLQGPQGPQGERGEKGDTGPKGADGALSDWMQNNPSGSGYVKNRTHYAVDAVSIPRNTPADEGAPSARIYKSSGAEYAVRWVKMSDVTPGAEIVIGAGTVQYNANNALGITEECILDSTSDGYVIGRDVYTESTGRTLRTAYAVVCFNAGYQANGFPAPEVITSLSTATIPEPGLYLPVTDAEQNTYTGFALPEHIKALDDKYIPDNIARKTDLENIEVPDDHINGLIDEKLDAFGKAGEVVMPETTFDHNGSTVTIHTPWAVEVKAGNEYIVTIDGKVYRYAAVGYSVNGIPLTMIGNGDGYAEVEHLNPDAPFSIMVVSNAVGAQMGMYGTITKHDGIHSYTISIVEASRTGYYYCDGTQARLVTIKELKKALGVSDTGATILPETTVTLEDNMGFIVDPLSGTPEVETTYTVMYNGVAYDCPALEFVDDGVVGVILGNSDMFEQPGGNPDAPFAMLLIPTGADGMYGMFVDLSGATEVTLSVVEQGGTVADKPYVNKDVTVIDAGLTYSRGVVEIRQEGNILWLQDSGVYNFTDAFEAANNRTVLQFTLPKKLSDRIPNVNGVYGTTGTVMYFPALAYENVTYTTFNCQSYIKRSAIGDTEDTYQVVYTGCSAISGGGLCGFHLRMPILLVDQ